MSIGEKYKTLPDTLQDGSVNNEFMEMPESLFVHLEGFEFSDEEIQDIDFWFDNLGIKLFPLHCIEEFNAEDQKNTLVTSPQKITWNSAKPIYKHRFIFNWKLAYHKLINEISGIGELYALYTAKNYVRGVKIEDKIRGFKLSSFLLEPFAFSNKTNVGNSELYLEHFDSNELNKLGYEVELGWMPKKVDRLPVSIKLTFTETKLGVEVKYLNNLVPDIKASEIKIYDKNNGYVAFSTFVPGDGFYQLSNFDKKITSATIFIKSRIYIGCKSFVYSYTIKEGQAFLLMTGESFNLMTGVNLLLMRESKILSIDYGGVNSSFAGYRKMSFRITDDGNIVENLSSSVFQSTSGKSSSIRYQNNGVYTWFSNFADIGTLTIVSDEFSGSLTWDVTNIFYEANMQAMEYLQADNSKFVPLLDGLTLNQKEELTNPLDSQWKIKILGSKMTMVLTNIIVGNNYDILFNVLSRSTDGTVQIFDNTIKLADITAVGETTVTYTASSNMLFFYFGFFAGPLDILIDSIKVIKK